VGFPLLAARVELTAQNEVTSFEARGSFLGDAENDALARAVTDTPEAIARRAHRFGSSDPNALIENTDPTSLAERPGVTQMMSM